LIFYDAFDLGNWSWTISADAILLWVAAFLVLGIGILTLVDFVNKKGENDLIWSAVFIGMFLVIYTVATSGTWAGLNDPGFGSIGEIMTDLLYLAIPGLVTTAIIRKTLGKEKLGNIFLLFTVVMTAVSMVLIMDASNGQWLWVPPASRISQLILIIPSAVVMILVPLKKKTDNKASLIFAIGCILLATVYLILGLLGFGISLELAETSAQGNLADFAVAGLPFLILGAVVCFFDSLIVIPKKWKNMEVA
jgi:predicted neutral ceramidase superfamily lipid hydrolase